MRLKDLIKNLQSKHPDLQNAEVECIIVRKDNGNIITLVAEMTAQDMQKLMEMFNK